MLWLNRYKEWSSYRPAKLTIVSNSNALFATQINELQREKNELETQHSRLHDLLERGIYDEETYLLRSKELLERLNKTTDVIERLKLEAPRR